jgi:PST family polysaccharide transporter
MAMCLYTAGHSFDSLASEIFKASGRPNFLLRMHLISMILTAILMIALLPFGLFGLAAVLSIRAVGISIYAVRTSGRVIGIPVRRILIEVWPPAVAAIALAAVVFPIDHFVVHADSHRTIIALALLIAEGTLGVVVYLVALTIAAPATARALLQAARRVFPVRPSRRRSGPFSHKRGRIGS